MVKIKFRVIHSLGVVAAFCGLFAWIGYNVNHAKFRVAVARKLNLDVKVRWRDYFKRSDLSDLSRGEVVIDGKEGLAVARLKLSVDNLNWLTVDNAEFLPAEFFQQLDHRHISNISIRSRKKIDLPDISKWKVVFLEIICPPDTIGDRQLIELQNIKELTYVNIRRSQVSAACLLTFADHVHRKKYGVVIGSTEFTFDEFRELEPKSDYGEAYSVCYPDSSKSSDDFVQQPRSLRAAKQFMAEGYEFDPYLGKIPILSNSKER